MVSWCHQQLSLHQSQTYFNLNLVRTLLLEPITMAPNYSSIKDIYADLLLQLGFFLIHAQNFYFHQKPILAFTALVSGNLGKMVPDEKPGEEDVCRVFSMHLHVSQCTPLAFGVRKNGAHLAVVGHGRDVANAKYSDWVRMRKPLEKLRPPSATELLLSNDGDHILEGCLTNFFVLCRKDNMEEDDESAKNMQKSKYGYSLELQTAPISGGVLPGVVREVVIEVCLEIGIPVREVAPSWSKRYLWEEAFITSGLRLLQHVDTIRVPVSWNSLSSKTWKEVTWEAKEFEEGPGSITTVIQEEVVKRAKLEGHPVKALLLKVCYTSAPILVNKLEVKF